MDVGLICRGMIFTWKPRVTNSDKGINEAYKLQAESFQNSTELDSDGWINITWLYFNHIWPKPFLSMGLNYLTRPTLERRATLGHFRSIKPNMIMMINHFAN